MKWVGVFVLSLVMGSVLAGLVHLAAPSMSRSVDIVVAILGALLVLKPMIDVARAADTIEPHHGKQFD
jgi:hypothetical protein